MKIKKYVKPKVLDLSHGRVKCNCANGSVDSGNCADGTQADSNCTQFGSTAGVWCLALGTAPSSGCLTGTIDA